MMTCIHNHLAVMAEALAFLQHPLTCFDFVQKYAAEAWDALSAAPSPEELKEGPRLRHATKLKPFR